MARVRPAYPATLFDDVLSYSRSDIGGLRALEVGAGTGRATEAFAEKGLPVVAVEPDDTMAEVLARRVARFPGVEVVRASFEEFRAPQRFGLLFSAEAWHWTVPESRWSLAADALEHGATLALFWNTERIAEPGLRTIVLRTFAQYAPSVVIHDEPPTAEQLWHRWPADELAGVAAFTDLDGRHYQRRWNMPKIDYLGLMQTRSQFRMLPTSVRRDLLAALTPLFSDDVPLVIHTTLILARRGR